MSLTSCSRHPVKLFLFFLPFLPPLVFEKAEIMPPFVLALRAMNKRVNSLPLADVALHHDGIGRV